MTLDEKVKSLAFIIRCLEAELDKALEDDASHADALSAALDVARDLQAAIRQERDWPIFH